MRAVPPIDERDLAPLRVDLVLSAWPAIGPMLEAMHRVGLVPRGEGEMRRIVELVASRGGARIDHPSIAAAVRVLAALQGQHASDWLEATAQAATMPRRKPPPATDLVLRLEGVECSRLVLEEADEGIVRVTIWNHRGDVVSYESGNTANALDGAIRMADARREP
jgi:hypothetical protein